MGDYYKYKKILVILMIISCGFSIIKNIFKTNVQAAEDVNSSILSGDYVVQTDNHYLTLMSLAKSWQDVYCTELLYMLNDSNIRDNTIKSVKKFYQYYVDKQVVLYFYTKNSGTGFYYQVIPISSITKSNITISGFTWQDSYNFNNIPFLQITRSTSAPQMYLSRNNGLTYTNETSGTSVIMAIPCLGLLSNLWVEVFTQAGLINSQSEYEDALANIQGFLQTIDAQTYASSYFAESTFNAVTNTYNYMNNHSVETITDTGINQPEVSQPDLSDTFDTLTDLLTNENYHSKNFILTLPNNDKFNFSIDPDFLKTCLTRVGGTSLVTIIQTLWYIGLYGIMIFLSLKIIGSLLAGDLDSVVGSFSPVNSVVNSSLECTGAFKLGDNSDGAFRRR